MRRSVAFLGAVGLAVVVGGCVTSTGRELDPSQIRSIKTGVTTKAQVRSMFGEPQHREAQPNGMESWMYTHGASSYLPGNSAGEALSIVFTGNVVSRCQAGGYTMNIGVMKSTSVPCDQL